MTETEQAKLLRDARGKLSITNEELARRLGISLSTLLSWLRPGDDKPHRKMPQTAKLLLERILADKRRRK